MAVPMVASAMSTVITTTPLFAAVTLILQRFAAVIFVTMIVGLLYVLFFLTPMLAMFGPGWKAQKKITEDTPITKVVTDMLITSKGVRFVLVTVITILVLVRPLAPLVSLISSCAMLLGLRAGLAACMCGVCQWACLQQSQAPCYPVHPQVLTCAFPADGDSQYPFKDFIRRRCWRADGDASCGGSGGALCIRAQRLHSCILSQKELP